MRTDSVIKIGKSLAQHGPANDRVYLLKLDATDLPEIVDEVCRLGRLHGYSKLFAKVPEAKAPHFVARGFIEEARVPGMYKNDSAGLFMSKYLDAARAVPANPALIADVLDAARRKAGVAPQRADTNGVAQLAPDCAEELARLYGAAFASYPFPIHDPAYLREAMRTNVIFFGMREHGKLVAAASAEMDLAWGCAEMTDFATAPEFRGRGAASNLLARMEKRMRAEGIHTAYTIARAESLGMNIVFARGGYVFSGTLCNNTQIGGKLESMNVWHKKISSA